MNKLKKLTLLDAFPFWMTNGLFSDLGEWVPWASEESINPAALDFEYFGNRSGEKLLSPLMEKLCGTAHGGSNITAAGRERIVNVLKVMYADAWKRIWDAMKLDYQPLENYNSTETERTNTDMKTGTNTDLKTGTNTDLKTEAAINQKTNQKTDTKTEHNRSETQTNTLLPLGSTTQVGVNGATVSGTGASNYDRTSGAAADNETSITGSAESNYNRTSGAENDNYTHHTGAEDENYTHTTGAADDNFRILTRSGNIGVTTSQQMLESEIELRRKLYFDMVFEDVDKVVVINYWR